MVHSKITHSHSFIEKPFESYLKNVLLFLYLFKIKRYLGGNPVKAECIFYLVRK